MNELINVQSRVIDRINSGLTGKKLKVLMDSANFGRTYRDAPEIDGKVEVIPDSGFKIEDSRFKTGDLKKKQNPESGIRNLKLAAGDFINVKITGAAGYLRRGTLNPK